MPPVKKDKQVEEKPEIVDGETPSEMSKFPPAEESPVVKPDIYDFKESLLRLGINVADGMYDKSRFPSPQEVAGIEALCKLYSTLNGN